METLKKLLIFWEMELLENSLYFLKIKLFFRFQKMETLKKIFICQEVELCYISGSNFPSSKNSKKS